VLEIKIPEAGESIQEVQIGQWLKQEGDWVEQDESVVDLETDKASMELPAPAAGRLAKIHKHDGEAAEVGDVIAEIDEDASRPAVKEQILPEGGKLPPPIEIMPAAQRLLAEHGLQAREVEATGPGGRLLKEDVLRHLEEQEEPADAGAPPEKEPEPEPVRESKPAPKEEEAAKAEAKAPAERTESGHPAAEAARPGPDAAFEEGDRQEEVVPMTLIRRRIAERLVEAQQTAALLTTFNEIDMTEVMALRQKYREPFEKKYEIKLGFMSFCVKAAVEALKECPAVNAEIRDRQIVYRNYFDIGVAIGGGKGLVVPVMRNAERLSFAEIERQIADYGARAKVNKIKPEELEGGTFTITNGGIYGSLLSTPIVNPPQSGVLGMHAIKKRPIAVDDQVQIRPMMYVALTYDHRIVDGREAVTFLKRIKDILEEPARMLLEV